MIEKGGCSERKRQVFASIGIPAISFGWINLQFVELSAYVISLSKPKFYYMKYKVYIPVWTPKEIHCHV